MDTKLNSNEFNQKFWDVNGKKDEFNKTFSSFIARYYDEDPLFYNGRKYEFEELNVSYKNTLKQNLNNILGIIDTNIKKRSDELQAEEDKVNEKQNLINEGLDNIALEKKRLDEVNDNAVAEYSEALNDYAKYRYLREIYCEAGNDDKKRNEYLARFEKIKEDKIAKIHDMQEKPDGIVAIELDYDTKFSEIKQKYSNLIKTDVYNLASANKYFNDIGFSLVKKYKVDGDLLSKEFNDFKENEYDKEAPILKAQIEEAQEKLKNISFDNLKEESDELERINAILNDFKKENELINNFSNDDYIKYLENNKKALKNKIISESNIKSKKNKILSLNNKINTLEKNIEKLQLIFNKYDEREKRFEIYRNNFTKNVNLYKGIANLSEKAKDEYIVEKFLNEPSELKIEREHEDALKAYDKAQEDLANSRGELSNFISELSDIELNNSTLNAQIEQYDITINNMRIVIKKEKELEKRNKEISQHQSLAAKLIDIKQSCNIILDAKTSNEAKMEAFLSMAMKYLTVTEGKYQVNPSLNASYKNEKNTIYPLDNAFLQYQKIANLDNYTIDFANPNNALLNRAGIIAMYNSAASDLEVVESKIEGLNIYISNPLDLFKENRAKEQSSLEQKARTISKQYHADNDEFTKITNEIATYSAKLSMLDDKLNDYKEKLAINMKNLADAKINFFQNKEEDEALFAAKNVMRKDAEANIKRLKQEFSKEIDSLKKEYDKLRNLAIEKNNKLIKEYEADGFLKIESDDEKIMYMKNQEAIQMLGKSLHDINNLTEDLKLKVAELEVKKDKAISSNKEIKNNLDIKEKELTEELSNLKGPNTSYSIAINNYKNELTNKETYLGRLNKVIKDNIENHKHLTKLQRCAINYYCSYPTKTALSLPKDVMENSDVRKEYIANLNTKLKENFGENDLIDFLSIDADYLKIGAAIELVNEIEAEKTAYYEYELQSVSRSSLVEKEIAYSKYDKSGLDNYFFSGGANDLLRNDMKDNHLFLRGSRQYKTLERSLNELSNANNTSSNIEKLHHVRDCALAYLNFKNVNDGTKISKNTKGRVLFALNLVARINVYDKAIEDVPNSASNRQAFVVDELGPNRNSISQSNIENTMVKEKNKEI